MILYGETDFYKKYAKSSNDEMDIILFRGISCRSYGWTHVGEFLQSLCHVFLTLLSSKKCYSSPGVFEFLFHVSVIHGINTTGGNNVMESTLQGKDTHLDFPLWHNSVVHTTISSKYVDNFTWKDQLSVAPIQEKHTDIRSAKHCGQLMRVPGGGAAVSCSPLMAS